LACSARALGSVKFIPTDPQNRHLGELSSSETLPNVSRALVMGEPAVEFNRIGQNPVVLIRSVMAMPPKQFEICVL
jgi:hypothetical protein